MVKKMFIEIRLCNPMTYIFKGHVKIVNIYMVKFNVSILNRLKIIGFFCKCKVYTKTYVIFNKTVTKLVTILTKWFFTYLNPTSYLNPLTLSSGLPLCELFVPQIITIIQMFCGNLDLHVLQRTWSISSSLIPQLRSFFKVILQNMMVSLELVYKRVSYKYKLWSFCLICGLFVVDDSSVLRSSFVLVFQFLEQLMLSDGSCSTEGYDRSS